MTGGLVFTWGLYTFWSLFTTSALEPTELIQICFFLQSSKECQEFIDQPTIFEGLYRCWLTEAAEAEGGSIGSGRALQGQCLLKRNDMLAAAVYWGLG